MANRGRADEIAPSSPKGNSISDYTADKICFFTDCINGLPRQILGYATPEELFERHFDRIYDA